MSHDVLARRLALILTKLNNGERFTLEELAIEFGTSTKTIMRDIRERFSYLEIKKEGKYYFLDERIIGKLNLEDIKNFAMISGIKSLYPKFTHQFLTELLDNNTQKSFLVKNNGFEDIEDRKEMFEELNRAILSTNIITFKYNDKPKSVEPYKLIHTNGIWYLCANDDNKIKTYTLSKIKQLKTIQETFTLNTKLLQEIKSDESKWFSSEQKEVILKIDNQAKEYFLRKPTLSNMTILEKHEDYFIVSTKVAFDDEILHLVKYWIPYIQIIEPKELTQKLHNILTQYLKMDTTCPNTILEFSKFKI